MADLTQTGKRHASEQVAWPSVRGLTERAQIFSAWSPRALTLAGLFVLAAGLPQAVLAAEDCGDSPCPGTQPAIWPDRSATLDDGVIRILGWNLLPQTPYDVVIVLPGESAVAYGPVFTDAEGDLLGNDYNLPPEEAALLTEGQPYSYVADPALTGVYEVRIYAEAWGGDLAEVPVATTTFLHN
jgi:hypothetical protein